MRIRPGDVVECHAKKNAWVGAVWVVLGPVRMLSKAEIARALCVHNFNRELVGRVDELILVDDGETAWRKVT